MSPDEIRAILVPNSSVDSVIWREMAAQVAQLNVNLAAVLAGGFPVQVASQAAGGLPVVIEPTPTQASGEVAGTSAPAAVPVATATAPAT
jgi:hypothetical protein